MSTVPTINERAWAVDLISEINRLASSRCRRIQSAGGEWGVSADGCGNVLFPDVLLFGDPARSAVLQGWELKMPDTPVTDSTLLDNAQEKCRRLGLSSFLVWNARDAVLYRVDDGCREAVRTWHCAGVQTRADVIGNKSAWVDTLCVIIDDLNDFFEQGILSCSKPLPAHLNTVIEAILQDQAGSLAAAARTAERGARSHRTEISQWWRGVKSEHGNPPENAKYTILATEILLHWIQRFLFAHYLQRFVSEARLVTELKPSESIIEAESGFRQLSGKHDFAQIFRSRLGSDWLSQENWQAVLAFNRYLQGVHLPDIEQRLLQETLHAVRRESQRKIAGQYCTPVLLAALLVRLAADDLNAPILDPCCGTGTIAREVLAQKVHHGLSTSEAVRTTWASDRYAMPLQFTTLSLTQGDAPFETLRVFQQDVMTLHTGLRVSFVDAGSGASFSEALPAFPCIILNPPFVRFEDWMGEDTAIADIRRFVSGHTGEEIDGRSDYFVSILLHLWRLLGDDGRIGMIVPNAWMGAEWGLAFRRQLRQFYTIECVVTSGAGRWFRDADVVTNILVLKKQAQPDAQPLDHRVIFAVTQSPISAWTEEHVANMADSIGQGHPGEGSAVWLNQVNEDSLDQFERDGLCWTACFANCQWLDEIRSLLIPVADLFDIHRGERRGWDKLFFPEANSGIEDEYLLPVVKSTADIRRLDAKADGTAFCCSRSIDSLERLGHVGALAWIRRFEHANNGTGKPLPEALARGGYHWYEMRPDTTADLAVSMNPGNRLFFARLQPRSFVNQRLIRFTAKPSADVLLSHALLCSLTGAFYLEALGFGRGLGALDLNATKLARQMRMLDPARVTTNGRKNILAAFSRLRKRYIQAFDHEIEQEDRLAFERTVLAEFNVSSLLPQIIESVQKLHRIRSAAVERTAE